MKQLTLLSAALFLLLAVACKHETKNPPANIGDASAYTCPMHPEQVSTIPGVCPKCNMALIPMDKPQQTEQLPAVKAAAFACPMECQGDTMYVAAGKCPVCGMDLVAKGEPQPKQ